MVAGAVVAIALAGGGFLAGTKVSAAQDNAAAKQTPPAGTQIVRRGAQPVSGHVISTSNGSITVQVNDPAEGQPRSVVALVGSSAHVVRTTTTDLKPSDIKVGDEVTVIGQTDSTSGAVTANAVVVGAGPQLFFGGQAGGGPRQGGSPRPSATQGP